MATGLSSHFLAEKFRDEVPEDDAFLDFFCGGAIVRRFGDLEIEFEKLGFFFFWCLGKITG